MFTVPHNLSTWTTEAQDQLAGDLLDQAMPHATAAERCQLVQRLADDYLSTRQTSPPQPATRADLDAAMASLTAGMRQRLGTATTAKPAKPQPRKPAEFVDGLSVEDRAAVEDAIAEYHAHREMLRRDGMSVRSYVGVVLRERGINSIPTTLGKYLDSRQAEFGELPSHALDP